VSKLDLYKAYANYCAERSKRTPPHHFEAMADWKQLEKIWHFLIEGEEMLTVVSPLMGRPPESGA
jgi:hypothetical protein